MDEILTSITENTDNKSYPNAQECEHGKRRGECVTCWGKIDPLATLTSVKRTLEQFVKSEQEIVIRHQKLFSVDPAEVRAVHRLEAFQTALGCFPDYI